MKKLNIKSRVAIVLLLISIFILPSCDKNNNDIIFDFVNIQFKISVVNSNGSLLIDTTNSNNILDKDIYVMYDGEKYPLHISQQLSQQLSLGANTKANMPMFDGFALYKNYYDGNYYLMFGEFDGADNYDNLTFDIYWSDGSVDKYKYKRKVNYSWITGNYNISDQLLLNGKKMKGGTIFTMTKVL